MAPVQVGHDISANKRLREFFIGVKWEHLTAGVCGGVLSTLVLHPLDLIKVRFQVNEGVAITTARPQYRGITDALFKIGRTEGIKGLYQGVTPNVWGAGASWGLYFFFYNALKTRKQVKEGVTMLSAQHHMMAAAQAGVICLSFTNPIWVAKTRLCLQYDKVAKGSSQYKGVADCLIKIYKTEGIRGWYKGFVPGIFGVSHGAFQFMAYEELKKSYNKYRQVPLDTTFNTFEYLTFAAISKIFAASLTYPYQVVRSRLQDQHREYRGVRDVLQQIWRLEGARGFYKGLWPSLLRVTPACCITFVTYEHIIAFLLPKKIPSQSTAKITAQSDETVDVSRLNTTSVTSDPSLSVQDNVTSNVTNASNVTNESTYSKA